MLSPEAYSPWKTIQWCRVYIIYPHFWCQVTLFTTKSNCKCTHLYHRQLKSSFFVPLSLLPWAAASLHSTTSAGWSWKEDCSTPPSSNLWNLCCDRGCHRSAVLQHHHSFTHNRAPHIHASVSTGKPKHLKSSASFYSNYKLPWQLCTYKATNRKLILEENKFPVKERHHNL